MDSQKLVDTIDNEIYNLVPQLISEAVTSHTHNGSDSQQVIGSTLVNAPQPAVTAPTGGGSAGVDNPARQAINDLIARLQALGLLN